MYSLFTGAYSSTTIHFYIHSLSPHFSTPEMKTPVGVVRTILRTKTTTRPSQTIPLSLTTMPIMLKTLSQRGSLMLERQSWVCSMVRSVGCRNSTQNSIPLTQTHKLTLTL